MQSEDFVEVTAEVVGCSPSLIFQVYPIIPDCLFLLLRRIRKGATQTGEEIYIENLFMT